MSDTMAVRAFREFGHDSGCVRNAVAVLTFWHHFVFLLVTGNTKKCFVLGFAGNELVKCLAVTSSALLGRCVSCIGNGLRHMGFVAFLAVAWSLISGVRLVALGTLWNFTMDVVAE